MSRSYGDRVADANFATRLFAAVLLAILKSYKRKSRYVAETSERVIRGLEVLNAFQAYYCEQT
jgi:hypothetical protein